MAEHGATPKVAQDNPLSPNTRSTSAPGETARSQGHEQHDTRKPVTPQPIRSKGGTRGTQRTNGARDTQNRDRDPGTEHRRPPVAPLTRLAHDERMRSQANRPNSYPQNPKPVEPPGKQPSPTQPQRGDPPHNPSKKERPTRQRSQRSRPEEKDQDPSPTQKDQRSDGPKTRAHTKPSRAAPSSKAKRTNPSDREAQRAERGEASEGSEKKVTTPGRHKPHRGGLGGRPPER
jgi:hypothetical protein